MPDHASLWPEEGPAASIENVIPVVGILAASPCPPEIEEALGALFGEPVERAGPWEFDATDYYEGELGPDLRRSFLAFRARQPQLVAWKLASAAIESNHARPQGGRRFNLDPGYVSLGGLFLASTKAGPHRVHLAHGIHAEITLFFGRGAWQKLPWTFPDFRTGRYDAFLTACRDRLKRELRGRSGHAG